MACAPCQKRAEERRKLLMEQVYGKDFVNTPSEGEAEIVDKWEMTEVNSVYAQFKAKILNAQSLVSNKSNEQ